MGSVSVYGIEKALINVELFEASVAIKNYLIRKILLFLTSNQRAFKKLLY